MKTDETTAAATPSDAGGASAAAAPKSFEQGIEELEAIVQELERGELSLEESVRLFEKGVQLSNACRRQLEDAETRVEILMQQGGKMVPEPVADGAGLSRASNPGTRTGSGGEDSDTAATDKLISDDSIPF